VTLYDDVTLCMMMCHRYDLHLQHVFDDVTLYDDVTLCMMMCHRYDLHLQHVLDLAPLLRLHPSLVFRVYIHRAPADTAQIWLDELLLRIQAHILRSPCADMNIRMLSI